MWEGGDLKSLQAGYLATVAVSHYVVLAQGEEGQVSGGRLSEGDVAAVAAAAVATAAVAAADVASGKGHVREMRELENGGSKFFSQELTLHDNASSVIFLFWKYSSLSSGTTPGRLTPARRTGLLHRL